MSYVIRFLSQDLEEASRDPSVRFWRNKPAHSFKRLADALEKLESAPYTAARSHRLKVQYSGIRAADVVGTWRLLYKICEECYQDNLQSKFPLDCCSLPSPSVVLATVNIIEFLDYH